MKIRKNLIFIYKNAFQEICYRKRKCVVTAQEKKYRTYSFSYISFFTCKWLMQCCSDFGNTFPLGWSSCQNNKSCKKIWAIKKLEVFNKVLIHRIWTPKIYYWKILSSGFTDILMVSGRVFIMLSKAVFEVGNLLY